MNTPGNIPFSWENRPGVRKDYHHETLVKDTWTAAIHDKSATGDRRTVTVHDSAFTKDGRLQPPPCDQSLNKATCHDLALPLPPPCVFRPHLRSSSRRSKEDDPFLMAYKECTKSNKEGILTRKYLTFGSCKYSSSVRDDSIVRVSRIPMSSSNEKKSSVLINNHQG